MSIETKKCPKCTDPGTRPIYVQGDSILWKLIYKKEDKKYYLKCEKGNHEYEINPPEELQ